MTKIKLCGLSRPGDIEAANRLLPDHIGFVFAPKSKRYLSPEQAAALKKPLDPRILAVGVFVDEAPEQVAALLNSGTIDLAQLHGNENEAYLKKLRALTQKPIIQAFRIASAEDLIPAAESSADHILLDSGAGGGKVLDWELLRNFTRPYFLAGGLEPDNVAEAVSLLHPFAVDVSSGIETEGKKDQNKMEAFTKAVRKEEEQ